MGLTKHPRDVGSEAERGPQTTVAQKTPESLGVRREEEGASGSEDGSGHKLGISGSADPIRDKVACGQNAAACEGGDGQKNQSHSATSLLP